MEQWHIDWAKANVKVYSPKKQQPLYLEGETQKVVYLVCQGLLARIDYHTKNSKQRILHVAMPGMALMTTDHLYTRTASKGDIISLRSSTRVIQIPYRAILDFKHQEPHLNTLINVLGNKKKKQLVKLREISHGNKPFACCIQFIKEMPQLHQILTNEECAALLGISVDTVYRAQRYLLKK